MASFLLGAATGTIVGLLYAPEKGRNTRDKLSYKLDTYRSTLQQFVQDLSKGNIRLDNKAKKEGEEVIKNAKEKAEKLLDDVDALLTKFSNILSSTN